MIVKVMGQLEVICVVLGTGLVNLWRLESFPPLSTSARLDLTHLTNQKDSAGSLNADTIVAQLWQAFTNYMEVLEPERAAEAERIERRLVRKEQEVAYEESLRKDQLKVVIGLII